LFSGLCRPANNNLGENLAHNATLVGDRRVQISGWLTLLLVVVVAVAVAMGMAVMVMAFVIMVVIAMRVSVPAEHEEAHKIGEQASRANDENELWVLDFGRVDKSGDGFKNNGDAEGNEENGVEEGT
jgi:hypothetical protein